MKQVFSRKSAAALLLLGLLLVGAVFGIRWAHTLFLKRMYPCRYGPIVRREASESGLDPELVYAVIRAESNFDPDAKSRAGAIGLMQLTPATFEWLRRGEKSAAAYTDFDLYRPDVNVRYGCRFLSLLLKKYRVRRTALCAYNAGMGNVNAWLKDPSLSSDGQNLETIPYAETRGYADAVEKNYRLYRKLYDSAATG